MSLKMSFLFRGIWINKKNEAKGALLLIIIFFEVYYKGKNSKIIIFCFLKDLSAYTSIIF